MIRKLLLLLLLLIAPLALASCDKSLVAPPLRQAEPALWVMRDGDTTIYLFGTVHLFTAGTSWLRGGVRTALDQSGELMLELKDQGEIEGRDANASMAAQHNPVPIAQRIPAETLRKLKAVLADNGLPADAMDHYDAWYAAIALSNLSLRKIGYRSVIGVDWALAKDARIRSVPVDGFETVQDQLGYLSSMSAPAQLELLDHTLDSMPNAKAQFDATSEAWIKGDPDTLAKMMNAEFKNSPELVDTMLVKRNARWTDWLAKRMEKPGTIFVAVGAGHLAGGNSIQQMLIKRGFKVNRIHY